jgi:hypothetical protein
MDKKGYVYFFKSGDGLMKIGRSRDVYKRYSSVKTACPTGVEILGYIKTEDSYELEKKFHDYFAKHRVNGEWFALTTQEISDMYFQSMVKELIDYEVKALENITQPEFEYKKLLLQVLSVPDGAVHQAGGIYFTSRFLKSQLGHDMLAIRKGWMEQGFTQKFKCNNRIADGTVIKYQGKPLRVIMVHPNFVKELNYEISN